MSKEAVKSTKLLPKDVRAEAARLARLWADERELTGDEEGAGEFRDLAKAIDRIRLRRSLSQGA